MVDETAEFDKAVALHKEGRIAEAQALCEAILTRDPDHPRALHMLGTIRFMSGAQDYGISLLSRAVGLKPDYAEAEFNLGAMLVSQGRPEAAVEHYVRAAEQQSQNVETQRRLGATFMDLRRFAEAEEAFRRAAKLAPQDVLVLVDLCTLATTLGRAQDGVELGRRAVELAPDFSAAHVRLGRALKELRRYDEAVACYRRALELEPSSLLAGNFLASVLIERDHFDEAEATCREILARAPNDASALFSLAMALQARGDVDAGLVHLRRAVALAPHNVDWHRALLSSILYTPKLSAAERYADHTAFGQAMAARVVKPLSPPANPRDPDRRLRIGWLSSDFRAHPVGRNVQLFFVNRDRSRFEYFVYADLRRRDDMTEWFRAQSDGWRPITGIADDAVAEMIRADGIDVMIYLAGRFDFNRPQIAAWRPAPVQFNFHDVTTSGVPGMDYFICDRLMAPRRSTEKFSERPLRLPNFYVHAPIDFAGPVTPPPSIARGYINFVSYNNPTKISDPVLSLWADVLRAVPGSRLSLKYKSYYQQPSLQRRVRAAMEMRGIDPARVTMGGSFDTSENHIAIYRDADIALDTFPFTGSTTTFEALSMGVPVVTLTGESVLARWTPTMMRKVGLEELVAGSPEEFVAIAAGLAADRPRLEALRSTLRDRVAASPICNGGRAVRYLERGIRAVWKRWCNASQTVEKTAMTYSLESDVEYFAGLVELMAAGTIRFDIDEKRLDSMNSPVYVEADKNRWAVGGILLVAAAWWVGGMWVGIGAFVASVAAYAIFGRRDVKRRIEGNIREKALKDIVMWRRLWRYGGVRLISSTGDGVDLVCAAPDESWIRFVENVLKRGARPA